MIKIKKKEYELNMIYASIEDSKYMQIIGVNDENSGYKLAWNLLKEDMKLFKETTLNKVVIMGWNTFESLNRKPLKDRLNIVLFDSKRAKIETNLPEVYFIDININNKGINLIDKILIKLGSIYKNQQYKEYFDNGIFVIGGSNTYDLFIDYVDYIHHSKICDSLLNEVKNYVYIKQTLIDKIDERVDDIIETKSFDNFIYKKLKLKPAISKEETFDSEIILLAEKLDILEQNYKTLKALEFLADTVNFTSVFMPLDIALESLKEELNSHNISLNNIDSFEYKTFFPSINELLNCYNFDNIFYSQFLKDKLTDSNLTTIKCFINFIKTKGNLFNLEDNFNRLKNDENSKIEHRILNNLSNINFNNKINKVYEFMRIKSYKTNEEFQTHFNDFSYCLGHIVLLINHNFSTNHTNLEVENIYDITNELILELDILLVNLESTNHTLINYLKVIYDKLVIFSSYILYILNTNIESNKEMNQLKLDVTHLKSLMNKNNDSLEQLVENNKHYLSTIIDIHLMYEALKDSHNFSIIYKDLNSKIIKFIGELNNRPKAF